jgi:hypothetical protein
MKTSMGAHRPAAAAPVTQVRAIHNCLESLLFPFRAGRLEFKTAPVF